MWLFIAVTLIVILYLIVVAVDETRRLKRQKHMAKDGILESTKKNTKLIIKTFQQQAEIKKTKGK